jgi:hypothetical protein
MSLIEFAYESRNAEREERGTIRNERCDMVKEDEGRVRGLAEMTFRTQVEGTS